MDWLKERIAVRGNEVTQLRRFRLFTPHSTVVWILVINLLVAATAFFKDVTMAAYFGTSSVADAFSVAYYIPDTLGNGVFATAVGLACVPAFSRLLTDRTKDRFLASFFRMAVGSTVVAAGGWLLLVVFGKQWMGPYLGNPPLTLLTLPLYYALLPALMFFPLAAVGTAALQALGHYRASVAAPLVLNVLVWVASWWLMHQQVAAGHGVEEVAWAVLLGVIAMAVFVWVRVLKRISPMVSVPIETLSLFSFREDLGIWRTLLWYGLYLGAFQSVGLVERYLAARLPSGTVAGLSYAYRVSQFPIWVYVAALATFILPPLARGMAKGQTSEVLTVVVRALKYSLIVAVPTMLFFSVFRQPLVTALLSHGAFGLRSVQITSGMLLGYAWTILGQSVTVIGFRFFLASGNIRWPVLVSVLSALVNVLSDFVFVRWYGAPGLGFGAAAGASLNALLMYGLVHRGLGIDLTKYARALAKIGVSNLAALLLMGMELELWDFKLLPASDAVDVAYVGFSAVLTAGVYLGLLVYLGVIRRPARVAMA